MVIFWIQYDISLLAVLIPNFSFTFAQTSKFVSSNVQRSEVGEVDIGLVGNCLRRGLSLVAETNLVFIVFVCMTDHGVKYSEEEKNNKTEKGPFLHILSWIELDGKLLCFIRF